MLSNVSIVGINQNCVVLGAAATLNWVCGTGLNANNTADREVVGFSNFTTLSDITLTRTTKTGSTTLATFDNVIMSSGQKTFRISGRTSNVSSIDDRVEITSCTLYAANYVSEGYGYVRKTDTRSNFAAFTSGGDMEGGGSLYFAKNCQDYGGQRIFIATNVWYFSCVTAATRYNTERSHYLISNPSIISFDSCLFDINTGGMQIRGNNLTSKFYVRNCTIQQSMIGYIPPAEYTPCDVDRWEFAMQSIEPKEPVGNFGGTNMNFLPEHFISTDYFVTMTAGEVGHTCPMVLDKTTGYVKVGTNSTTQPWAVCVTLKNSAAAPIPPF
jgi:hypothetical protein